MTLAAVRDLWQLHAPVTKDAIVAFNADAATPVRAGARVGETGGTREP
ncbi:hypothetical protein [Nocardia sp. SC052]